MSQPYVVQVGQPQVAYAMQAPAPVTIVNMAAGNTRQKLDLTPVQEWHNGLFSCCSDCSTCIYGYFCPYCMAWDISKSIDECCCFCVLLPMYRQKIRHQYRLEGGACTDICCFHFPFTASCALCQMYNELKHNGDRHGCCCDC